MKEVVSVLEDALGDVRLNIARSLVSLIFHHYVLDRVYILILTWREDSSRNSFPLRIFDDQ